jgi:hypothetical protein
LLYLPTHGGDARDALLVADASPTVYLTMAFEVLLLGAVAVAVVELVSRPLRGPSFDARESARWAPPARRRPQARPAALAAHIEFCSNVHHPRPDTLADRS